MKKWLFGVATLPFLAGVALAGEPVSLNDKQMDKVTAGFDFLEVTIQNLGSKIVAIDLPPLPPCTGCFLNIVGTPFPAGVQSFQLQAQFGP